ncbi:MULTISPECIES: LacI family DNA-binding transcriptional regulator [unclassified Streptomyces]|uniref:LacI family DNA-binding transcriptional regulator n=1 Tax=unclassified Streptomyces TaxID=2593676 RepID=UPI00099EAF5B|nr:LacI family DNA-binding transcriptional regulator [Streptomyces sp. Root369]
MAVTSADVARRAGLSRATVSQILNGHDHRFTADTAQRVRQAARELGYEPSAAGRMLRRGSSDFIVALIPDTTYGSNLQDIFDPLTESLAENGLSLVLHFSMGSPGALDRILGGIRPRAVLSLRPFSPEERQILAERKVPGFDTTTDTDFDSDIGALQAQHLIARGFQRLAFVHLHDRRSDPYGPVREQGVVNACAAAGLPSPRVLGIAIDRSSADEALATFEPGTGIACYNDDVAIALMTAVERRGWRIPADIGLIGMDNTPLAQVMNPPLTTVGYDLAAAAHLAANAALRAIGQNANLPSPDIGLRIIDGSSC